MTEDKSNRIYSSYDWLLNREKTPRLTLEQNNYILFQLVNIYAKFKLFYFLSDQTKLHCMIVKDPSNYYWKRKDIECCIWIWKTSLFGFPSKQTESEGEKREAKPCNGGALMLRKKRKGRVEVVGRWVPLRYVHYPSLYSLLHITKPVFLFLYFFG